MSDTTAKRFAHVRFGVRTDVGRKRRNNEDAHGVFCVADGMGGAQDGEVASRAVVESLAGLLPRWAAFDPPMAQEDRLDALARALDAASFWVKSYADSQGKKGCGSTFVGICLDPADPAKATAVHAGDSRIYRVRGRKIVQITRDHSVAQMAGVKDEKELSPMFRSLILRAVGIKPAVEAERTPFDIAEGDRILVCSDGLSRMVPDKEIARIVEAAESPNAAADALVDRANELGGKDNVTVVAVFVGALPAPAGVRARLTEAEMAALFAAPGGGEGDSTTGVTDGETRSDDTGLTIPKGVGAFDTSSSGEFLPPGGLPPPKAPLDDEDDDEDDEPPPDTDEIPASARMKRRLRGLALAASHAVRTPAGASVLGAALVAVLLGISVPPMRRAAAERRRAEEAARIEAEKEAEAKRIEEEKAKAEAEKVAEAKRAEEALLVAFDEWIGYANETSNRICKAVEPSELPSAEEIEKLFGDGVDAFAASISPRTRSFIPFRVRESDWSNRCVRLAEARAARVEQLEKESEEAAQVAAEAARIAAEAAKAAAEAKDRLAEQERKWMAEADGLSNRIERAVLSADAAVLGPAIQELFLNGAVAFGALDETVRGLPEFSSAVEGWSNRCDRLSEACSRRAETLAKEEKKKAEDEKRERKEKDLASSFEKWCGKASALSNRISRANAPSNLPAEREVADLSARGRDALSGIGFAYDDPLLVEKEAAWSNRCDRLAAQWTERKDALDEEAKKEAERAESWQKFLVEKEKSLNDDQRKAFLEGVLVLQKKLGQFKEGADLSNRLARSIGGIKGEIPTDAEIGSLCVAVEDVFGQPSILWRFAATPGVAQARYRYGQTTDPVPVPPSPSSVWSWLDALDLDALDALDLDEPDRRTDRKPPDDDLWDAIDNLAVNFVPFVIGEATDPPGRDNELQDLCTALKGKVTQASLREAADCLESIFDHWERFGKPELATVARVSAVCLKKWRKGKGSEPDDRFVLMIAGFETIFCSKDANQGKAMEDVRTIIDKYDPSVETYVKMLSSYANALTPAP